MYFVSHSISARSSASPRNSTIGACVWVLISPGSTTCPAASTVSVPRILALNGVGRVDRDDVGTVDRNGAVRNHPARPIHRHDRSVDDDERDLPFARLGKDDRQTDGKQPGGRQQHRSSWADLMLSHLPHHRTSHCRTAALSYGPCRCTSSITRSFKTR